MNTAMPRRLLVVDDQPLNIQALYRTFVGDHQVLMATSGEQALSMCLRQQPDLVLLDVVMPGMDGFEVCERLKSDPATRDIPVIFVTAHTDPQAETHGLELGAVDFISKPINPQIVRARVKTHLTLKHQADLLRQWSSIDGGTGVHNRRHFEMQLAAELGRAVRNGNPLSVVLIKIDGLRACNEAFGYRFGDELLRNAAQSLRQCLKRPADLLARHGGDDFACLLPETDLAGAAVVAGQLRLGIMAARRQAPDTPMDPIPVSLGVASWVRGMAPSAEAMLTQAAQQRC